MKHLCTIMSEIACRIPAMLFNKPYSMFTLCFFHRHCYNFFSLSFWYWYQSSTLLAGWYSMYWRRKRLDGLWAWTSGCSQLCTAWDSGCHVWVYLVSLSAELCVHSSYPGNGTEQMSVLEPYPGGTAHGPFSNEGLKQIGKSLEYCQGSP